MDAEAVSTRDWFENTKGLGMRLGLDTTREMLGRLGDPQLSFPAIHVAGSNGKGSTCAMLSRLLSGNGLRVGLFTSPHLCRVEERVRIDGRLIPERRFTDHLSHVRRAADESSALEPTYYEVTFLVAMLEFAAENVEWAVVETGLGGRLDATRLVQAEMCVLTSLSLEHTAVLGETLAEIAAEKAAIARPGKPLIARWTDDPRARERIMSQVDEGMGRWFVPEFQTTFPFEEGIPSAQAMRDARLVPVVDPYDEAWHMAMTTLAHSSIPLTLASEDAVEIRYATQIPGRMQLVHRGSHEHDAPFWIIDSAHNPDGMRFAFSVLSDWCFHSTARALLLGATPQTDLDGFLEPVADFAQRLGFDIVIVTEPTGGRHPGLDRHLLADHLSAMVPDLEVVVHQEVGEAVEAVRDWFDAQPEYEVEDPHPAHLEERRGAPVAICVGSLYLAGNVLSELDRDSPEDLAI